MRRVHKRAAFHVGRPLSFVLGSTIIYLDAGPGLGLLLHTVKTASRGINDSRPSRATLYMDWRVVARYLRVGLRNDMFLDKFGADRRPGCVIPARCSAVRLSKLCRERTHRCCIIVTKDYRNRNIGQLIVHSLIIYREGNVTKMNNT